MVYGLDWIGLESAVNKDNPDDIWCQSSKSKIYYNFKDGSLSALSKEFHFPSYELVNCEKYVPIWSEKLISDYEVRESFFFFTTELN